MSYDMNAVSDFTLSVLIIHGPRWHVLKVLYTIWLLFMV